MLKWVLFGITSLLFFECKKKEYNSIYNIRYEVRVMSENQAIIRYYSDLYHQKGNLIDIVINDTTNVYYNNTWYATRRKPVIEEEYFIEVNFTLYNNPDKVRHGVFVFVNDTSLIDSFTTVTQPGPIVLKGRIPKIAE